MSIERQPPTKPPVHPPSTVANCHFPVQVSMASTADLDALLASDLNPGLHPSYNADGARPAPPSAATQASFGPSDDPWRHELGETVFELRCKRWALNTSLRAERGGRDGQAWVAVIDHEDTGVDDTGASGERVRLLRAEAVPLLRTAAPHVVVMLAGGHLAVAVFEPTAGRCTYHKTASAHISGHRTSRRPSKEHAQGRHRGKNAETAHFETVAADVLAAPALTAALAAGGLVFAHAPGKNRGVLKRLVGADALSTAVQLPLARAGGTGPSASRGSVRAGRHGHPNHGRLIEAHADLCNSRLSRRLCPDQDGPRFLSPPE